VVGRVDPGSPSCNDRGADLGSASSSSTYHKRESDQRKTGDRVAKHQVLSVCGEDDGEIFEDSKSAMLGYGSRIDGDGEELQCFGTGVDDRDEERRDREPGFRI
jgi:hypothetical protein